MINEIEVKPTWPEAVNFPHHALAHQLLDNLKGLELGASSHNSFHLPGSINIAPEDEFAFYRDGQVAVNGKYAAVDLWGEADNLPLMNDTVDYIISSHVFEHLPNPMMALYEFNRVVRDGGYVMMIVPLRDSHVPDRGRDLTTIKEWVQAFEDMWTPDTLPPDVLKAAGNGRGHIFVYSPETLKALIKEAFEYDFWSDIAWELIAEEAVDSKVSNGFTLVYKVRKTPTENAGNDTFYDGDVNRPANPVIVEPWHGVKFAPAIDMQKVIKEANKALATQPEDFPVEPPAVPALKIPTPEEFQDLIPHVAWVDRNGRG